MSTAIWQHVCDRIVGVDRTLRWILKLTITNVLKGLYAILLIFK